MQRSGRRRTETLIDTPAPWNWSQGLVVALICLLPLALGGVHAPVRIVAMVLAFIGLGLQVKRVLARGGQLSLGLWGAALAVAVLMGVIQWLPLPAGLVESLSPARHAASVAVAVALGESPPAWIPLGLDASVVAYGLVGLVLHGAVFAAARHFRRVAVVRERLVIAIELAAAAAVAVGLVHAALGWDRLLGFYESASRGAGGPFPSTFVNPNHFAALCLLAALVAFGAAIANKAHATWHAAMGAIAAFGVASSLSRANGGLLLLGVLLVGLPWALRKVREGDDEDRPVRARRLLGGVLVLIFLAFVLVGPDRWSSELAGAMGDRSGVGAVIDGLWSVGAKVGATHPWVGVGVGAMALGTPAFVDSWTVGHVTHAHNAALEVTGELGFIAGGLVGLLALIGLVRAIPSVWRDPVLWAALVALTMGLAQNMVDFSWWIPGVGVPVAALAGLVSAVGRPSSQPPREALRAWSAFALVGVLGLGAGIAAWTGRASVWHTAAEAALADGTAYDWRALARAHPADFVALGYAGALAERSGDVKAAAALAPTALALAPRAPIAIGRAFKFAVIRGQDALAADLLERLMTQGHGEKETAFTLALSARNREAVLEAFFGHSAHRVLRGARLLAVGGDAEAARALLAWGVGQYPDDPHVVEAFGATLPTKGAEAKDLERLGTLALVKAGEATSPESRAAWERVGYFLEGLLAAGRGRQREAWALFMGAAEADGAGFEASADAPSGAAAPKDASPSPDVDARAESERRVRALIRAADAAIALGDAELLGKSLDAIDREPPGNAWTRGQIHLLKSQRLEMGGDARLALRELQLAIRLQPNVAAHHERLARLFDKTGDREAAKKARAKAAELAKPAAP